jgi:hypothetical protein
VLQFSWLIFFCIGTAVYCEDGVVEDLKIWGGN